MQILGTTSRRLFLVRGHSPSVVSTTTQLAAVVGSSHVVFESSSSMALSQVEFFDGSTIQNPVVVSDLFWSNLQSQFTILVISQIVAVLLFVGIAYITVPPILLDDDRHNRTPFANVNNVNVDLSKLFLCLVLDGLGSISVVGKWGGEIVDVIYAPLAAYLLRNMFGGTVIFVIEFLKEILPFTDLLPFCTISWLIHTFAPQSSWARIMQIGSFSPLRIPPKDSVNDP